MRPYILALLCLPSLIRPASAQWTLQATHTTADLRGIDNVGHGIAWASGTDGTILRTLDGGEHWQLCAKPPNGERLDFRAIQAFDNSTAIIMSIGKGDLSRLYKTTDACQSWHLLFTNPDAPEGFFDQLLFIDKQHGLVFGDPVRKFSGRNPVEGGYYAIRIRVTNDGGETWGPVSDPEAYQPGKNLMPVSNEGLFAASNSSAAVKDGWLWIGLGGARVLKRRLFTPEQLKHLFESFACGGQIDPFSHRCGLPWVDFTNTTAPLASRGDSAGIFSLHFATAMVGIAVGGDYKKPGDSIGTAAFTTDGGKSWVAAATPPHGFRSAVAYDSRTKTFITVGPNGTDISTDDGRNWHALKPDPAFHDTPDADQHWNALSLPYAVGPHGRIATLRPSALQPTPRN